MKCIKILYRLFGLPKKKKLWKWKKKKKALKMTSQLVIFRAYLFIFFRPPDPKSEKNSRKSTNKKIWLYGIFLVFCWICGSPHM